MLLSCNPYAQTKETPDLDNDDEMIYIYNLYYIYL